MSGFVNWLAHETGQGVKQAWRPFGYAYGKDSDAADWIAGEILMQRINAIQAGGAQPSSEDAHLMQVYKDQGPGAFFRAATEQHPFIRFAAETTYAPSTAIGIGAALGPETQGIRGLPAAFRAARGAEKAGVAAQAADRLLALPFTAAGETVTRPFRAGSVVRRIPAIDHALSLSGESLAKIQARALANALNAAQRMKVPLDEALGRRNPRLLGAMGPAGQQGLGPVVPGPGRPHVPPTPGQMTPLPPAAGAHTMGLGNAPYGTTAATLVPPSTLAPAPSTNPLRVPTTVPLPQPSPTGPIVRAAATGARPSVEDLATAPHQRALDRLYEQLANADDNQTIQDIYEAIAKLEANPPNVSQTIAAIDRAPRDRHAEVDALMEWLDQAGNDTERRQIMDAIEAIQRDVPPPDVLQPGSVWHEGAGHALERARLRETPTLAAPEITRAERIGQFQAPRVLTQAEMEAVPNDAPLSVVAYRGHGKELMRSKYYDPVSGAGAVYFGRDPRYGQQFQRAGGGFSEATIQARKVLNLTGLSPEERTARLRQALGDPTADVMQFIEPGLYNDPELLARFRRQTQTLRRQGYDLVISPEPSGGSMPGSFMVLDPTIVGPGRPHTIADEGFGSLADWQARQAEQVPTGELPTDQAPAAPVRAEARGQIAQEGSLPATWEETHFAQNELKDRMYALVAQAEQTTDQAEKTALMVQAHELRDRIERLTEHSRVLSAQENAAARAAAVGESPTAYRPRPTIEAEGQRLRAERDALDKERVALEKKWYRRKKQSLDDPMYLRIVELQRQASALGQRIRAIDDEFTAVDEFFGHPHPSRAGDAEYERLREEAQALSDEIARREKSKVDPHLLPGLRAQRDELYRQADQRGIDLAAGTPPPGGLPTQAERDAFYAPPERPQAPASVLDELPEPVRPESAPAPPAPPAPVTAQEELNPMSDSPQALRDRWDHRESMVEKARHGDLNPIYLLADKAGLRRDQVAPMIGELFGGVVPGQPGFGKFYQGTIGTIERPGTLTKKLMEQYPGQSVEWALAQAADDVDRLMGEALASMGDDRLHAFITYLQSRALERRRAARLPLPHGYEDMAPHQDIKEALRLGAVDPDPRLPADVAPGDITPGGLPPVSGGAQNAGGGPNVFHSPAQWYRAQSKYPGIDLPDQVIDTLREHESKLVEAQRDYHKGKQELDTIIQAAALQHPSLNPQGFTSARQAVETLKGLIPDDVHAALDRLVSKWEDMGIDLHHADPFQAIGAHTMTQIARELAPKTYAPRSNLHRFMSETLPSAWKEQALLTPRYGLGNTLDIISKSLIHGMSPFGGFRMTREGTALHHGVPKGVSDYAERIGVDVPADLIDTGREALVGSERGFVQNKNRQSVFRNAWKSYNPVAWLSEANFALAGSIESAARTGIWEQASKDYFAEHGPRTVSRMLDRAGLGYPGREQAMQAFRSAGFDMSAEKAEALALARGVDPNIASSFRKQWHNLAQDASNAGVEMSNHLHFDYAKRTNLDQLVGKVMPFHFWASRNIPFYLQHLAEHPQLAIAWMRYNRIAAEEKKAQHLPGRFRHFISLGGNGLVSALFGGPGVVGINPSQVMSITGQLDPGADVNTEGMAWPVKWLTELKAQTGLGVGPVPDAIFNMTGMAGKRPHDPSLIRMGPLLEQLTGVSPDLMLGRGMGAVRGALRGWDTSTLSGSQYRDWQISRRILELADEEGTGPNDPKYLLAINDPTSPIYKQAQEDVIKKGGALNLISSISPLTVKYAGNEELKVQEARDVLGPQFIPGESKADRDKRLAAEWQKDPQRSQLRALYDASGQSPLETELKRGLQYYEQLKLAGWDNAPSSARSDVYDLFYKRFPLVKEYFDFLGAKDLEHVEIPPGESFNQFFEYRKATHPTN